MYFPIHQGDGLLPCVHINNQATLCRRKNNHQQQTCFDFAFMQIYQGWFMGLLEHRRRRFITITASSLRLPKTFQAVTTTLGNMSADKLHSLPLRKYILDSCTFTI